MLYIKDTNFVINCAARTGSTFLLHLLRSNVQIMMHGEVITPAGVGALTGVYGPKLRQDENFRTAVNALMIDDPKRFIYDIIYDKQGRRVVGWKYKTDESLDPSFEVYSNIMFGDLDLKVINLRRRDLLSQYISHHVVTTQTGVTLVKDKAKIPEVKPFVCDLDAAYAYITDVITREEESMRRYSKNRSFDIFYEDAVKNENNCLHDIQVFLGVKPVDLTSETKKIIKHNYGLVENLDDILDGLKAKGLESRLGG